MLRKGGKEGEEGFLYTLIRGVDAVVDLGNEVEKGRKRRRRGGEGFLYTPHPANPSPMFAILCLSRHKKQTWSRSFHRLPRPSRLWRSLGFSADERSGMKDRRKKGARG